MFNIDKKTLVVTTKKDKAVVGFLFKKRKARIKPLKSGTIVRKKVGTKAKNGVALFLKAFVVSKKLRVFVFVLN